MGGTMPVGTRRARTSTMAVQPAQQSVLTRRLFTGDEYYRMAEVGILKEDERIELIDGEIVQMNPPGPDHSGHVNRFIRIFKGIPDDSVLLSVQNPVRVGGRA